MSREYAPTLGTLAVDTALGRVGKVTGWDGEAVTLVPLAGGAEWQAEYFRPASEAERLHARVAEANARSRGEL